jgi:hypothetical protein
LKREDPTAAALDAGDPELGEFGPIAWQMSAVIMSAISRWPGTIQRIALCAMMFWVCGGSHRLT